MGVVGCVIVEGDGVECVELCFYCVFVDLFDDVFGVVVVLNYVGNCVDF